MTDDVESHAEILAGEQLHRAMNRRGRLNPAERLAVSRRLVVSS